jgi:uncharacterized linocin/CFP29 family protein
MSAMIQTPQQIGGMLVDDAGRISVNAGRSWVGKDGRSYINVNGKAQSIQTNALLQKDEWIAYDSAVRDITTIRLNGIADLRSMGLVYNAGDLGSTIAEWDASSDMTAAEINMAGVTTTEKDTVAFTLAGVPIPIVRKDFQVNIRRLLASRRMGASVDVTGSQIAARLVAEKSEDMLFNGADPKVSGYSIYGYTNHPQRNTGSLVYDWAAAATTGKQIVSDVLAMIAALEADRHYGPFNLYVPANFWPALRADYSDNKGDNTIIERIRAIDKINDVKVSDVLTTDNVVMVQMTSEVVDLAVAQDVTTVQWERGDGMQTNFAVMAAWAPRIKADYDNHLGIAHYTYASA